MPGRPLLESEIICLFPDEMRDLSHSDRFTASWFPRRRNETGRFCGFVSERVLSRLGQSLCSYMLSWVDLMVEPPVGAGTSALAVAYVPGEPQVCRARRQRLLWKIVYGRDNPEVAVQLPNWTTYPSRPPPASEQTLAALRSRENLPVSLDSPLRWISPPLILGDGTDGRDHMIPVCEVIDEIPSDLYLRMRWARMLMVGQHTYYVFRQGARLLQKPCYQTIRP